MKVTSHTDASIEYDVDPVGQTCTCPAWQKGFRRPCKHLMSVMPPDQQSELEGFTGQIVRTKELVQSTEWTLGRTEHVDPIVQLETDADIGEYCRSSIVQALESYEFVAYDVNMPNANAKWRLASGIQKAIRRNKPHSAKMLSWALWHVDRGYLYYRLAVIAVEDVGIGNLKAITQLFYVLDNAQFRREAGDSGEWLMLSYLLDQLATGAKDRNSAEFAVCGDFGGEEAVPYEDWSDGLDDLAGVAKWVVKQTESKEGRTKVDHLYKESGVPAAVRYCTRHANNRMKYRLGSCLGMVWRMAKNSVTWDVADDDRLLDDGQIGGYTGATFDKHTGEGKRAIGYWLKVHPEIRQYVDSQNPNGENKNSVVEQVGMVLFTREGSLCRDRLVYDGSAQLIEDCRVRIERIMGVEYGKEFEEYCLMPHYETLQKARRAITTSGK